MTKYDKHLGIDVRSCGCPIEYHLADCPIIAPPSYEPYDYDGGWLRDYNGPDPYEFELERFFDTEEEARAFTETLKLDWSMGQFMGRWRVEYDV